MSFYNYKQSTVLNNLKIATSSSNFPSHFIKETAVSATSCFMLHKRHMSKKRKNDIFENSLDKEENSDEESNSRDHVLRRGVCCGKSAFTFTSRPQESL